MTARRRPPAGRAPCSSAHRFLRDDVAGGGAQMIAEAEPRPFGLRPVDVREGARDFLGARHDLVEAAVAIFAAEDPVFLCHGHSPYSAATNWAASVDSLSATVDAWPAEMAV